MGTTRRDWLRLLACAPLAACSEAPSDPIAAAMARIRPLFRRKTATRSGDWLADHKEAGQTYQEFRAKVLERAVDKYSTLRVVPIGALSERQAAVVEVTKDFLRPFFGLELVVEPAVRIEDFPDEAVRVRDPGEYLQLLTSHVLNKVLPARRTARDAAVLGITAFDLWPGPGWNFVFGQASLTERVGVWSMARNGDLNEGPAMRALCALRTTMTASHETGHMLGIRHCIAYQCGMNGSNHVEERDRHPLEFCPECQAKLWWTCRLDPLKRSRALEAVARKHGFERIAGDFSKQTIALTAT